MAFGNSIKAFTICSNAIGFPNYYKGHLLYIILYSSTDNFLSPGFWLVNILLWKFDTSLIKEMKIIKTQFFWWRVTKKCHKSKCKYKVTFFTVSSAH